MAQAQPAVPLKVDLDSIEYGYASDVWIETKCTDNLFSCPFGTFYNDYCATSVREEDVAGCMEYLSSGSCTDHEPILRKISDADYAWSDSILLSVEEFKPIDDDDDERPAKRAKLTYDDLPTSLERSVVDRYAPVFAMLRAIFLYGSRLGANGPANPYDIKQYPHELAKYYGWGIAQGCVAEVEWDFELEDRIKRATPVVHGERVYLTEDKLTYCVPSGRIVVPITCCEQALIKVREVLSLTAQHVFQNDPRRMWMYAMSIDGHEAYFWLFTRTHIVRVDPIDWVKDINGFVRLVLMLALSNPKELGLDPYVHRVPGSQEYIYEVNGDSIPLTGSGRNTSSPGAFYRTVEEIQKPGLFCLTRKTTRITKVIQVYSLENPTPIVEGNYAVIKDIWLEEEIPSEAENQERMFAAVDAFIAKPDWKSDRRLKDFDARMLDRLEDLFEEKKYRSLFLNTLHAWRGVKSLGLSENVEPVTHYSVWGKKLPHPPIPECLYVAQQQARFIYAEVCTPLTGLETFGEVMDIIRQTTTALQVLLCAGWVHRDISAGNILAYRISTRDSWTVKLTDFEFAKALGDIERLPKECETGEPIGTNAFMPHEIYSRQYQFCGLRLTDHEKDPDSEFFHDSRTLATQLHATGKAAEALGNFRRIDVLDMSFWDSFPVTSLIPSDADFTLFPSAAMYTAPVVHNYQHDLESLWWITLWFITSRIDHQPSFEFAQRVFRSSEYLSAARADVFCRGDTKGRRCQQDKWPFHPDLQDPLANLITELRKGMVKDTYLRPIMGQLMLPSSYSAIHALFAKNFDDLNNRKEERWAKMRAR